MKYISTRGHGPMSFTDILLEGLAPDGGLYLPQSYPQLSSDDLRSLGEILVDEGYAQFAAEILHLFIDDIPMHDLEQVCRRAYTKAKFGTDLIAPVDELEPGLWLAHLSQGPTAAFKDMAMQVLGQLFNYELTRRDQTMTILGATSGDTGSAAEFALLDASRVQVFMLSPLGRMTAFQRGQMYGIDTDRIVNVTVPGSFDDCQDLVKAVNADAEFKSRHSIGAVNSINWARLVAQVVYYISSWFQASGGEGPVSFTVPSGNFGNICAGHVARMMGTPISHLVCATNENNVLAEFFATGVYRIRTSTETFVTSSPSMDISKASNFERFFFDLTGRDADEVRRLFGEELNRSGVINIRDKVYVTDPARVYGFQTGVSTHADRVATIADVFRRDGYLIDPHTADAVKVAREHLGPEPMIALETALPVKFGSITQEAIGRVPPIPARFAQVMEAEQHTVLCDRGVDQLKQIIEQRSIFRRDPSPQAW
ncbi:MAG: threonine synthase [Propionibacteriaceae bacterium]|jgi:threonine synthase|nr:threonine synthase [Propionibacteriaceae bacterium]